MGGSENEDKENSEDGEEEEGSGLKQNGDGSRRRHRRFSETVNGINKNISLLVDLPWY